MARRRSFGARLGDRIRARREARGWSQARLGERAHLSPNYVGLLERGKKLPTLDTLVELARALDVHPAELLDDARFSDDWIDAVVAIASTVPSNRRALVLAVLKTLATHTSG